MLKDVNYVKYNVFVKHSTKFKKIKNIAAEISFFFRGLASVSVSLSLQSFYSYFLYICLWNCHCDVFPSILILSLKLPMSFNRQFPLTTRHRKAATAFSVTYVQLKTIIEKFNSFCANHSHNCYAPSKVQKSK